MKLGLQILTDDPHDDRGRWGRIRAQAEAAEEHGFDGIFVPTEISWRRLDSLSLLAALASVTERVAIGTNVMTLPLYAPLQVAEAFATMDQISGGRMILGVASGWRADEFAAAGVPFDQRVGRTYESIRAIRELWTQPSVTRESKYYAFDRVALELKPLQRPHPPVWVGAHAERAIARAGRHGLGWVEGPRVAMASWRRKHDAYTAAARAAGHETTELPIMREAFAAETAAEARKATEPALLEKYREYARQAGIELAPGEPSFDKLAPGRFIVGSVQDCRRLVDDYEAAGATWLILRMQYPQSDFARVRESIALFGREVRRA